MHNLHGQGAALATPASATQFTPSPPAARSEPSPAPTASAETPSTAPSPAEREGQALREVQRATGTSEKELAALLLGQACGTLPGPKEEPLAERLVRVMPALQGIAPRDAIEGMVAVQLVTLHNVALDQLHRAAHPDQFPDSSDAAVNKAAKLLRAFSQQLEALHRYRGKGQQKVTVKHVHVNSGGQAIVGAVEAPRGRGERG